MSNSLVHSLETNIEQIKLDLNNSSDLIIRFLQISKKNKIALLFLDGLSDRELIEYSIIEALLRLKNYNRSDFDLDFLKENILPNPDVSNTKEFATLYNGLLSGDTIILIDGKNEAFLASTRKWEARGVDENDYTSSCPWAKRRLYRKYYRQCCPCS